MASPTPNLRLSSQPQVTAAAFGRYSFTHFPSRRGHEAELSGSKATQRLYF